MTRTCDYRSESTESVPGAVTISHHLKILVDAGIFTRDKRGVWAYYALVLSAMDALAAVLSTTDSTRSRAISVPLTTVKHGTGRPPSGKQVRRSDGITACFVQIPKLIVRVRFSSPAPGASLQVSAGFLGAAGSSPSAVVDLPCH